MGDVIPISAEQPAAPTQKTATTGQALFAAIVDEFQAFDVRLPKGVIAIAAKKGALAINEGVDPRIVLAGCLSAIRQGKARFTTEIIADIAVADAGMYQTPTEHRSELVRYSQSNNPSTQNMLSVLRSQRDATKILKLGRGTVD